jgi:hypothetical protein
VDFVPVSAGQNPVYAARLLSVESFCDEPHDADRSHGSDPHAYQKHDECSSADAGERHRQCAIELIGSLSFESFMFGASVGLHVGSSTFL